MGVAVFKTGVIDDPSFFGLYDALSTPDLLSNGVLADVAKTGALSTLFAVALLASGQNSTITGTLTGQIIMEGFIHMRMPMWARRLITRLLSVVPVLICVTMTRGYSLKAQHEAINNLMNNSQVFLAFALPFSIIPLLMLTNSKNEMGKFKNNWIVQLFGWFSVIALTYLNLIGLPDQIESLFPKNLAYLADGTAILLIVLVIALLIWTIFELYRGNRKLSLLNQKLSDS